VWTFEQELVARVVISDFVASAVYGFAGFCYFSAFGFGARGFNPTKSPVLTNFNRCLRIVKCSNKDKWVAANKGNGKLISFRKKRSFFPPIVAVVTANGSCAYKSVLVAKFAAVSHIEYMVCFAGSI